MDAAKELMNKISSGSIFNFKPIEATASIESPAPTLSTIFFANAGHLKNLNFHFKIA